MRVDIIPSSQRFPKKIVFFHSANPNVCVLTSMFQTDPSWHTSLYPFLPHYLQSVGCATRPGLASPTTSTTATRTRGTPPPAAVAAFRRGRACRTSTTRGPSGRSPSPRPRPRTAAAEEGKALKVWWSCRYPNFRFQAEM